MRVILQRDGYEEGWCATLHGMDLDVSIGRGRTPLKAIWDLFQWEGIELDPELATIVWEERDDA